MPSNAEENSISYIFDTMSYGPSSDSDDLAKAWLSDHHNKLGLFINGQLKDITCEQIQHAGVTINIGNPTENEINKEIKTAADGFTKWKEMSPFRRAQCLYSVARNIQKHQSLMVMLETIQSQRPSHCARDTGVPCLIRAFYHYAGWAELLENETDKTEPYGVVAIMTEGWSSPLTSCWGIAPALATGNSIVLVPDRRCSLSCFLFAEICMQAGLPPGTVNVFPGYPTTYSIIARNLTVKKILFSGIPDRARKLQRKVAGFSNNISVDTGGRPTIVVFDSADLDSAVEGIIETLLYNDCRSYCAGVRVLVQDPSYKLVINKIETRMDKLRIGKCLDKTIDIADICLEDSAQMKLLKCLNEAKKEGSRIHPSFDKIPAGSAFPPTVVSGIQTSASLLSEEVGGPIVIVLPFRTAQEAVSLTNNGYFNSSVSIWSERQAVAMEVAYKIKSNIVWINSQNLMDSAVSYGSVIHTGTSQEGGEWALLNFRTLPHQTPNSSFSDVLKTFGSKPTVSPKFETIAENLEKKPVIDHTHKLYYGGAQKRPDSNSSYSIFNFKKEIIGYAPDAGKKDVRNAVEAAQAAFSGWSGKSGHNKAQILYYIAENMQLRSEEFSNRIAELTGKNLEQSQNEVQEAVQIIFHWATACDKYRGTVQETSICKTIVKVAEPLGVIGILCHNWKDKAASSPLFSFTSLLSAAIAAGNTIVVVPGECEALIALDMYQIFDTSDVPKGVINILTGNQDHLARCLAEHQNIQSIWYHADSVEGAAFVTYAAAENFKHVWIHPIPPSMQSCKNQTKEFMFHATKRKCIWLPSGDAFP